MKNTNGEPTLGRENEACKEEEDVQKLFEGLFMKTWRSPEKVHIKTGVLENRDIGPKTPK